MVMTVKMTYNHNLSAESLEWKSGAHIFFLFLCVLLHFISLLPFQWWNKVYIYQKCHSNILRNLTTKRQPLQTYINSVLWVKQSTILLKLCTNVQVTTSPGYLFHLSIIIFKQVAQLSLTNSTRVQSATLPTLPCKSRTPLNDRTAVTAATV